LVTLAIQRWEWIAWSAERSHHLAEQAAAHLEISQGTGLRL
jgi:hypothetical protein